MKRFISLVQFIVFIICFSYAQPKGIINGMVSDELEKPLAGVVVEIINTSQKVKTLSDGKFSFFDLGTGNYQILFAHPDYMAKMIKVNIDEKPGQFAYSGQSSHPFRDESPT